MEKIIAITESEYEELKKMKKAKEAYDEVFETFSQNFKKMLGDEE
mgnify:CR=1 FL=1|jgi:predicted CopG family antitoxin